MKRLCPFYLSRAADGRKSPVIERLPWQKQLAFLEMYELGYAQGEVAEYIGVKASKVKNYWDRMVHNGWCINHDLRGLFVINNYIKQWIVVNLMRLNSLNASQGKNGDYYEDKLSLKVKKQS
jgi:predicted transcriptional regulator